MSWTYTVQEDTMDQVRRICSVTQNSDWIVDIKINNCIVKFKLNTGADVNVLPKKYAFQVGLGADKVTETNVKLLGYSGDSINILGKCMLKVSYKMFFTF